MAEVGFVGFRTQDGDADILAWLGRQANKSAAIRAAIRAAIVAETEGMTGPSLTDVLRAVERVEDRIQAGVIVSGSAAESEGDWVEPDDVAAALDSLGV